MTTSSQTTLVVITMLCSCALALVGCSQKHEGDVYVHEDAWQLWSEPLSNIYLLEPAYRLSHEQIVYVTTRITNKLSRLATHGWSLGIPDRMLLLPSTGLRVVYGQYLDDEFDLRSLDGKRTVGFFRSKNLMQYLSCIDQKHISTSEETVDLEAVDVVGKNMERSNGWVIFYPDARPVTNQ